MHPDTDATAKHEKHRVSRADTLKKYRALLRITGFCLVAVVLIMAAYISYIYAASPATIRKPAFQHYHFRMQVLVDGKAVDFGNAKYQVPLGTDSCSVDLTQSPIHFHDNKNQMTHIHWDGMTGGLVLKYYGWNYIGGVNGALGYRFDNLPRPQKVPVMGSLLPSVPEDATLYIYTGSSGDYTERSQEDFLKKDLEEFFGKKSNLPGDSAGTSLLDRLFPTAYAHGGSHAENESHPQTDLEEINNLIGNVVIFAQKNRPTDQQVDDRFRKLEPLTDSTCGG